MINVLIKNTEDIPRKYVKLIKWKMHNLAEKFKDLLYVEVFMSSEGRRPQQYQVKLRLGIPGHDLIITKKSQNILALIEQIHNNAQLRLAKSKERFSQY